MNHAWTGWIDIPVVQAIEYFSGVLATFYKWGSHYAVAIGTIGLIWSAFKLANSRFTVKDFWWDTMYKWLLFILFMSLYPMVTLGMSRVANRIGIDAGNGKQAIIDSLTSMKKSIEQDLASQMQWSDSLNKDLSNLVSGSETITFETTFGNSDNYNEYIENLTQEIQVAKFNSKSVKKQALELVNEYREKNKYHSLYGARTLQAIKDILVEKQVDGTDGDILTDSYVDLNIWLKTADGNDSYYLSPGAIMRVTVLGCQIMWEKNQIAYALNMDEIDEEDVNFMKKGFSKMTATIAHVPTMIMTMFCCIVLVFCGIFACIQYVMTILEYTIVVGIGAFFIPFILFDGTKELPKKLIPVFTGFVIKMIVITICMFFVFYLFIQETIDIMAENGGMNWVTFVTIIFTCVIGFVLTQNAPKIAQTLLTGQPQLSMGELVTAAGTLAMGTMKGAKAAQATGHVAKEGARKVAQGGVDVAGGVSKVRAAGKAASQGVKDLGGSDEMAKKAGRKGMYAAVTGDLKDKFKNAGNNFLHGGGNKGGAGGGGGSGPGAQAHQRSGQNTSRELGPNDSRTLNTTSNPHFKGATKFDTATQQNTNMTTREFMNEKKLQGSEIGQNVSIKMMEAAEKKQQALAEKNKLPDNLTGGERQS
ncbi:type IV secretion system protein [Treponema sp.]|uniref:type IV secretion system protein n=1 Tax=Treponema sp. TaxID=166 RepID=UPI00298E1FA1|nr:type IV secretion system protein [Treponema sp.]MCQ2242533.1 type IV secretion system protein [Treponema sp.]